MISPYNGVQTFHEYLDPQTWYVDEPEPCPTVNICGQSVSLSFPKYKSPVLPLVGDVSAYNERRFTDTLFSSDK